jgi:K+-transporting ATPase A subunit
MFVLFLIGVGVTYLEEAAGNPLMHAFGLEGGNMEGKEVRFGITLSSLFAVITTAASCFRRCSRSSPRLRPAVRSMPCMALSPHLAG